MQNNGLELGKTEGGKMFRLPYDFVTEKIAFLGISGSGKTYGAKRLFEVMYAVGAQVIALDPVGVWPGLRVPGNGDALPIPVFGGLSGDLPIDEGSGRRLAEVIYQNQLSCVIDTSHMIDAEKNRFATDLVERFYELQQTGPRPVHWFVEESHLFIPQEKNDVPTKLLNRFARAVTVGRNFGWGFTLISQRPQAVNKRCLNQCQTLFAYRTRGKLERKAIADWFEEKDSEFDVDAELPRLERGDAIVFSPHLDTPVRFRASEIATADTSQTPKFGQALIAARPMTAAKLNIDSLREALGAPAQSDDPKTLRARVADLERQLKQAKPAFNHDAYEALWRAFGVAGNKEELARKAASEEIQNALYEFRVALGGAPRPKPGYIFVGGVEAGDEVAIDGERMVINRSSEPMATVAPKRVDRNTDRTIPVSHTVSVEGLSPGMSAILTLAAQQKGGTTTEEIAVVTGYKKTTRNAYIHRLKAAGLLESNNGMLVPTAAGLKILGPGFKPLPRGRALIEYWLGNLPGGERALFTILDNEATPLSRTTLRERTGYSKTTVNAYLARLSARRLVVAASGSRVSLNPTLLKK